MQEFTRSHQDATSANVTAANLLRTALSRVRAGFAPPAEIYRAEYRRLVDWSQFPLWARWIDPENYTGSCHEG